MIRHESVDEGVRGGLHKNTSKRTIEKVTVGRHLLVEAIGSEAGQAIDVDRVSRAGIDEGLELVDLCQIIVSGLVQIWPRRRSVALVPSKQPNS